MINSMTNGMTNYITNNHPFITNNNGKRAKGFTLIELLVAMTLGIFVTMGIYHVFFSTKESLTYLDAQSRMQEDARYAFSFISSKLQQAGDFGCQLTTEDTVESLLNPLSSPKNPDTFRPWRMIEGWEADSTGYDDAYTATLNDTVITAHNNSHWTTSDGAVLDRGIKSKRKSDILKIWYTQPQKASLKLIEPTRLKFPVMKLKRRDILTINDCSKIKLVQVCSCNSDANFDCRSDETDTHHYIHANLSGCSTPGNQTTDLGDINLGTAEVRKLEEAIFFVGKRGNNRSNLPSLYWKNLGNKGMPGNKQEILEGVESLQILYGEDTDGDKVANYYVSANSVTDWAQVISLRISLLMISIEKNLVSDNTNVFLNNHAITTASNDHHLRKVFTTTIALRNRIIGI